jgi:hypothetical protein
MTSTHRAVALRAVPQTDTCRIGATFSAWAPLAGAGQEAAE